jgi:YD repeat-containing protein
LNAVNNRTAKEVTGNIPGVNETYDYDAIDQLTGVTAGANNQTYEYDAVGNRTAVIGNNSILIFSQHSCFTAGEFAGSRGRGGGAASAMPLP